MNCDSHQKIHRDHKSKRKGTTDVAHKQIERKKLSGLVCDLIVLVRGVFEYRIFGELNEIFEKIFKLFQLLTVFDRKYPSEKFTLKTY